MMNFHVLLLQFILVCYATVTVRCNEKPHILIILSDDVGYNDIGLHGSNQIPTPNMDTLGYRGVILNGFYTQQTCTPSRAALLTGNYPIRSGMQGTPMKTGEERHLPLDMPTLPEKLKELGYKTHLVGKWHLGYGHKDYTPTFRGFDTHLGHWNGFCGYHNYTIPSEYSNFPDLFFNKQYFDLHDQLTPKYEYNGRYATEVFTERSVEIIENHDINEPMFLMVSHLAGHTGYDGKELGVPNVTRAHEKFSYIKNSRRQLYAEVISQMDDSIGKLMTALEKKNMLNNTIVIYFPDNGGQTIGVYANEASNWPLRGLKFTLFEGGVRGSAVMYSQLFEKSSYINNELIHITDLMPTLIHIAGGDVASLGKIDGINQWDVISKNGTTNRTELLLNIDEKEGNSGILGYKGKYKLLKGSFKLGVYDQYYGDSGRDSGVPPYDIKAILESPTNIAIEKLTNTPLEETFMTKVRSELDKAGCRSSSPLLLPHSYYLYDIENDPCETKNLISDSTLVNVVNDLKNRLAAYEEQIVPQGNKEPDPKSNPKNCNNTWYPWLDEDGCTIKTEDACTEMKTNVVTDVFHWAVDEMKNVIDGVANII